jgi:hypothetical protein
MPDVSPSIFSASAALDRLILAKQVLAAQQLHRSLLEIDITEGRLVRSGGAVTFLVEQVRLKDGGIIPVEDGERHFVSSE